jgi:hypothetical protein
VTPDVAGAVTPRLCACGEPIVPSEKVKEFGRRHGRDLNNWPARCARCIIDATVDLFMRVEVPKPPEKLAVANEAATAAIKTCCRCGARLGHRYYAGHPKHGDLCMMCWGAIGIPQP